MDIIEDECQIFAMVERFYAFTNMQVSRGSHQSASKLQIFIIAVNICLLFFLKILNRFLILQYFVHLNFFITIQLQNKVIADKICFPVYDYIIGLQQV